MRTFELAKPFFTSAIIVSAVAVAASATAGYSRTGARSCIVSDTGDSASYGGPAAVFYNSGAAGSQAVIDCVVPDDDVHPKASITNVYVDENNYSSNYFDVYAAVEHLDGSGVAISNGVSSTGSGYNSLSLPSLSSPSRVWASYTYDYPFVRAYVPGSGSSINGMWIIY